jgi:hypothetical protein
MAKTQHKTIFGAETELVSSENRISRGGVTVVTSTNERRFAAENNRFMARKVVF